MIGIILLSYFVTYITIILYPLPKSKIKKIKNKNKNKRKMRRIKYKTKSNVYNSDMYWVNTRELNKVLTII